MAKDKDQHYNELLILKTIAETLNQGSDVDQMLQSTLQKLLEVTDLKTGWIFLMGDKQSYCTVADYNLPPALTKEDKKPIRCGECLCLKLFWKGDIKHAVNIIECQRLHDAVAYSWGDTNNLTHHATIPLTVRGERIGLLNVGSPNKKHFEDEELTLLEAVAYQIGTAVERTRLYEQRKQQAVDQMAQYMADYYVSMNKVTRSIWKINDRDQLYTTITHDIGMHYGWSTIGLIVRNDDQFILRALHREGSTQLINDSLTLRDDTNATMDIISNAYWKQEIFQASKGTFTCSALHRKNPPRYSIAIPLKMPEAPLRYQPLGVLFIGRETEPFHDLEIKVLKILADHISLAMEKISLYEERQELLLSEERNRLARDLHDSVNQKLFSLSLTARGIQERFLDSDEVLRDGIQMMGQLSQEALTEMRSLIWQLRPYGLKDDILTSLQEYGKKMGIHITIQMDEEIYLPKKLKETLWRIGQEALNNVKKHAQTNHASIQLTYENGTLQMTVSDQGCGFEPDQTKYKSDSLGFTSMRERVKQINGQLKIISVKDQGTTILLTIHTNGLRYKK